MKKYSALLIVLVFSVTPAFGQIKWYQFSKTFIQQHYQADGSAIGSVRVAVMHPAKSPHAISCGGNDGELHIGVAPADLQGAVSGFAGNGESFGIVAEPPNVQRGGVFFNSVKADDGHPADFYGYFRVWNEGHDVTPISPSNPHHVLEVHPAWGIRSSDFTYLPRPAVIFPMSKFSGYGASKFVPLLRSVGTWLKVAEVGGFVYVQMARADNFYQLPVIVKQARPIGNGAGVAALVDVYSDTGHQNLVYQDLTVITAGNSAIAARLQNGWSTYLLGFFSINLEKAMVIATGHESPSGAVPATGALEFFTFGVPLQNAVSKSTPCTEEDD